MPKMTLQQAFDLAVQHHQAGRLSDAEAIYRQILAVEPTHFGSQHHLGLIAHQAGKNELAVALIRQALTLQPGSPEAHSNLGNALTEMGRLDEALAACRQAIALRPAQPVFHNNLGNALKENGQLDEAIAAYRQAISLRPDYPEAHCNLGMALKEQGQLDEAVAACRRAITLRPNFAEAHNNLGSALKNKGQLDEAIAAYHQALALRPAYPEAHNNLGNALKDQGQLDQAIAAYRQALAFQPDFPDAHSNLGASLGIKGRSDEAIDSCRQAIALQQDFPEAYSNLGNVLKDKGQLDEAIAAHRQALALKPEFPDAHSNLVFTLNYHPSLEASAIAEEHRRWAQRHAEPLRRFILPHPNERTPGRRLRVAYVSPDFRDHSVASFLEGLLAQHNPAQVEVFCYADLMKPDAVTARVQRLAAHWRKITGMPDAEVAEWIRRDGIDILVDLAGHTAHNRLLVFARKPAPVQVTWLGYPNTTGLDTMDYRLTDAFADPPGSSEEWHSEHLVRLPRSGWCYCPSGHSPSVSPPPVAEKGHITFGCFNSMPKINEPLLELWARILLAVPGSRLLLKNGAMAETSVQQRMRAVLEKAGVNPERMDAVAYVPDKAGHLASYGRVDIALDSFPYHGTTTTCEALWMGVPVVTLAGQTHVARVGVSLLSNLGHRELIAHTAEDYVRIAAELAGDLPRLADLRTTLRARMQASPLMDAPGFARDIEAAYRTMWRTWCEQPESPSCPK